MLAMVTPGRGFFTDETSSMWSCRIAFLNIQFRPTFLLVRASPCQRHPFYFQVDIIWILLPCGTGLNAWRITWAPRWGGQCMEGHPTVKLWKMYLLAWMQMLLASTLTFADPLTILNWGYEWVWVYNCEQKFF